MSIATYSFLPYLRQGLANNLQSAGGARATLTVGLDVHGDSLSAPVDAKNIEIYGPGDIVGLDPRAVVKTDPLGGVTNFEANYLPYIDFYDEDLPWRYTPAPPAGRRLNPWISLVVLAEGEFSEGKVGEGRPLPYITLKSASVRDNFFPKAEQLWAWAHVHCNGDLTASDGTIVSQDAPAVAAALDKLQATLDQNPDTAYSRLVCPRRLKPGTAYHAFVIPSYESGRLAGTGADAAAIAAAALQVAWEGSALDFPYYYRWDFHTGSMGDFEYLVRLLKPRKADSRVGRRVMDMTHPGGNLPWVEDPDPEHALGGILRLGGALRVPAEALTEEEQAKVEHFDDWARHHLPELHPFQVELAGLLNLSDDYQALPTDQANAAARAESGLPLDPQDDADPLITPPIYGRWHAMVERVYRDREGQPIDHDYNWLNELNLDPRFRVPAHFGTRVVQENQENYMAAAWEQIGEVLKANRQIRFGQFSIAAGSALYERYFRQAAVAAPAKALLLTAPLQARVRQDGFTLHYTLRRSTVPPVMLSAPMRRILRPRGRLATRLSAALPAGQSLRLETAVSRVSSGTLLPAPPKVRPAGMPPLEEAAAQALPGGVPAFLQEALRRYPWLPLAALGLALLLILLLVLFAPTGLWLSAGVVLAALGILGWRRLSSWRRALQAADLLSPEGQHPAAVDALPSSANFRLAEPAEHFAPALGGSDSAEAQRFKSSLKDQFRMLELVQATMPRPQAPRRLDPALVSQAVLEQIRPEKTVPAWTLQFIYLPPWIRQQLVDEGFVEAMAYPKINKPMYEDLEKISSELFLPNLNLIGENSITLLETNQPFVEAYMVGLNHEFGRELLWREYPTDQRGSYFRQFWDVSQVFKDPALAGKPEEQQREPYYDIPKLHTWRRASDLGEHDHRTPPGQPVVPRAVLVIRGELLKKYPTAVVYAHKAAWTSDGQGRPDIHEPRSLYRPEEGDKAEPDKAVIRSPMFSAKAEPDIYFFGFDLTVAEARGEPDPDNPTLENAGWFFVIKERPGEPRFGMDIPAPDGDNQTLVTWNDLDWSRVLPADEGIIDVLNLPAPLTLPAAPVFDDDTEGQGEETQYNEDKQVAWSSAVDAADLAYILYQVPMMVCVHAQEMLLTDQA